VLPGVVGEPLTDGNEVCKGGTLGFKDGILYFSIFWVSSLKSKVKGLGFMVKG
jgi:hypothetical protein